MADNEEKKLKEAIKRQRRVIEKAKEAAKEIEKE